MATPGLTTFDAAQKWLAGRQNKPTAMGSRELALDPDFAAQARMQAFFSARVASARILDALRAELDAVARGDTDYASARARLKDFLSREGYAPDDVADADSPPPGVTEEAWLEQRRISNLASTRRLDLILHQNAAMAHAIGQRQVSLDPDIMERWPYFRYDAREDERVRAAHAALDGLVLPKTDPFWHTHTPPWEFNCRCALFDCDLEEATRRGLGKAATRELPDGSQTATVLRGDGRVVNVQPSPSGYVFRPDAFGQPPTVIVDDPKLAAALAKSLKQGPKTKATAAKDALIAAERGIVNDRDETLIVVGPDGTPILRQLGQGDSVRVTNADAAKMKNGSATHNHPLGWSYPEDDPRHGASSFSDSDWVFAADVDLALFRATGPVWVYQMTRPQSGWPGLKELHAALAEVDAAVTAELAAEILDDRMTIAEAEAEFFHRLSQKIADRFHAGYTRGTH